jgi:hypothetical protein
MGPRVGFALPKHMKISMDEMAAGRNRVIDIGGRDDIAGLSHGIARGMRAAPKSLPSLLLWDDQGLKLLTVWQGARITIPQGKKRVLFRRMQKEYLRGSKMIALS